MTTLTIRRPDDWHVHLRDGAVLEAVTPYTSRDYARAIIMPNLVPPVVTVADARSYRERILKSVPDEHRFTPLMTLYLTEDTDPNDVETGFRGGDVTAVKLYPAGATTNSQSGVRTIEKVYPVLERMASCGMVLCVHGEVTDPAIDIFDREAVFIERVLEPLRRHFPELRIVMEHVTTRDGVGYVRSASENLAATITTHHLIINRNAILAGGIRPHYYCLPVAKREEHRLALRQAATSDDARFFLGTDSAPHLNPLKECACGCAGIFSSLNTLGCLAHVFEEEDALDRLEAFVSLNGPSFYRLPPNEDRVTLERHEKPITFPRMVETDEGLITVFDPMFPIHWNVTTEAG